MRLSEALRTRLHDIVEDVIAGYGTQPVTVAAVVTRAAPAAKPICEPAIDEFVCDVLRPIVRRHLRGSQRRDPRQLKLFRGFAGIHLPDRIAVPADENAETADEDDDDAIRWVVLERATVAELQRNITMRDRLLHGAQAERDKLYGLLLAARHRGAKPEDLLADVLR